MIFRIQFKKKQYERAFVKKYKPIPLVYDEADSQGFGAWQVFWKPNTLICYLGFMGYAEPLEIKKELKGKIKAFSWIAINDNRGWQNGK